MEVLNSRPELLQIIQKTAEKKHLLNYKITEVLTNKKGDGFLGEIFIVKLEGENNTLNLVLKVAFSHSQIRENVPIRHCYENEVVFYTSLAKILTTFGEERGESFGIIPKCLGTSLDDAQEVLVLENLRSRGFEVFDKKKILDEAHVRLIFSTYGKYHAYSFALRDQKPEEYSKVKFFNVFKELFNEYFKTEVKDNAKLIGDSLKPGEDDDVIEEYQKYLGDGSVEFFEETVTQAGDYPVLLHGDCWSNNMMFKYEGGSPVDVKLLDFQLCREGSPACDLSYCLYSGGSEEIFENLEEYLRVYHESLSKTLKGLGGDPERLYPFEALKEDWRRFAKFGMLMGVMVVKIKVTDQEDVLDFTDYRGDEDLEKFKNVKFDKELFNERMRALVRHLHKIRAL